MELTRAQEKIINVGAEIRTDAPTSEDKAFMARQFVQVTLPHSDPGNVPVWSRTNGKLTLGIQPGWDFRKEKSIGFPYGSIPRLLMFWITSEAVKTKNRRLSLGRSLAEFMRDVGLNPSTGGGKRSDAKRLREQMERLFKAKISFVYDDANVNAWLNMDVAPKGMVWWNEMFPENGTIFENWIELGEEFFKAITESPVPLDLRALKALKQSPLALDFYAWATYTAYNVNRTSKNRSVSWEYLHQQMGAGYTDPMNFKKKALASLRKIKAVYPQFHMRQVRGGIIVLPESSGAIPAVPKPRQLYIPELEKSSQTRGGSFFSEAVLERARTLIAEAATGWCVHALESQFHAYALQKGAPRNTDNAFIGFVKRKIKTRP